MKTLAQRLSEAVEPEGESKWSEEAKIAAATTNLRLAELLGQLRAQGWQPRVAYTWRSLATQARLRAAGNTKVNFSLHNVTDLAGKPGAYAADVFDRRYGWEKPEGASAFFKALGAVAQGLGLEWGGGWNRSNPHWAAYGLGWDPGHVQIAGWQDLEPLQARCLPLLLGQPYVATMTDGYTYHLWEQPGPVYTVEIVKSPASNRRKLLLPGVDDTAIQAILAQVLAGAGRPPNPMVCGS